MELIFSIFIFLVTLTGGVSVTSPCQDIDPASCKAMAIQNPKLCDDPGLSTIACPRFCGKCPLRCFDCTMQKPDAELCSRTVECQPGEQCMIRTLRSSADGHSEVKMQCASVQVCDMEPVPASTVVIGKRDVSIHCCKNDLCNKNFIPTSTVASPVNTPTPTPVTTTMSPTTTNLPPGCSADITIMIEDSRTRSTLHTADIIDFVKDTVDKLHVGLLYNKVSLTLFDSSIHVKWQFNDGASYDKTTLKNALDHLNFRYATNTIDYGDVKDYLHAASNHSFAKDRVGAKDVVVIISDNDTSRLQFRGDHFDVDKILFVSIKQNAYIGSFHNIAQNPRHVFSVPDYSGLAAIQSRLLAAICDPYDLL